MFSRTAMVRHTYLCFGNIMYQPRSFRESARTHVTLLNLIESDASTRSIPEPRNVGRPPNPSRIVGEKKSPRYTFAYLSLGSNEPEIYHQRERHHASARTPFFISGLYNHELISPRRRIIYELDVARAADRQRTTLFRLSRQRARENGERIAFTKGAVISRPRERKRRTRRGALCSYSVVELGTTVILGYLTL